MQTAAYPEETEVPVAQESHPHAHLVTLLGRLYWHGCVLGMGAVLGRGAEDMTLAGTPRPGLA